MQKQGRNQCWQIGRGRALLFAALCLFIAINSTACAFGVQQARVQEEPGVIEGRVVAILDGDTLEILDADNIKERVRLKGIDAPEKRQDYGQRAKERLSALVYDREVRVYWSERDRYGRVLGKLVTADGRDANLEMIRSGYAWFYKQYEQSLESTERKAYRDAETEARGKRIGLWADSNPTPPWEFRRQ